MEKFINKIAHQLYQEKRTHLEELVIIMPSKRAGTFFKKALSEMSTTPLWMPKIYAIEEWLEELSELSIIGKTTLLFEMYVSYQNVFPKKEQDAFDAFLKWAPTLLKDFNDIDAYFDSPEKVFNYIHQAKKIESWSPVGGQPSDMVQNYLRFWELMERLFIDFKSRLKKQNVAFQGMAYRRASEQVSTWISKNKPEKGSIYYVGFNAMNPCETKIMKTLISEGFAEVFWDVDSYYLNDKKQEAGKYLRQYKGWSEFENRPFNWVCSELKKQKKIRVYGVPKAVAQAQLAGSILNDIYSKADDKKDVALVLADEKLLSPVLSFLPKSVKGVNITMGNALRNASLYAFLDAVFQLHLNRERLKKVDEEFYYKDLYKVWQSPAFQNSCTTPGLQKIKRELQTKNRSFISLEYLVSIGGPEVATWLELLLDCKTEKPFSLIDNLLELINMIKDDVLTHKDQDFVMLEELYAFTKLLNQIKNLQDEYGFICELKTLHHLFQQSASIESMSFYGEPLSGLQLMGMLETRNLDFEDVVLLSVNEGFLPSGKTENSFIPFDIRKEVGLPTYEDMDAVFAYHFYRLVQRCKSLTLIYNTETDALGSGEKSRFINQLESELVTKYPEEIDFEQDVLSHKLQKVKTREFVIQKDEFVMRRLKEIATNKGFSPSSLNLYKTCPLQFYYEKVLKIKTPDEIEETIEASTLGTVIHRALEEFYLPFLGKTLKIDSLKEIKKNITPKLKKLFREELKSENIERGKNKLIFTVAEQFLNSFLNQEIRFLQKGSVVKIEGLEKDLTSAISIEGLNHVIKLNGNADRIDVVDGVLRIIDYKTGKVALKDIQADLMEKMVREKQYHKGFQLFLYAHMYRKMFPEQESLEAGIMSFRALKEGFLPAGMKTNPVFEEGVLSSFEEELKLLLKELFDPSIPFSHSNREEPCRFCDPEQFRL